MASIPPVLEIPIGDVIRAWREYHGLSVSEFAALAGIPKAYVSELEHRKIDQPGPKRMAELAAGLGIDYWDLVQRRLPPTITEDGAQAAAKASRPVSRHAGGFAFAAPLKAAARDPQTPEGTEEQLLRQLSDQVDDMRRTLDTLVARRTGLRHDHGGQ